VEPLQKVVEERARQDQKWGVQNHGNLFWLAVLMEEVGELAQAIIQQSKTDPADAEKELVQVAAVAVAWLECFERRKGPDWLKGRLRCQNCGGVFPAGELGPSDTKYEAWGKCPLCKVDSGSFNVVR
jgi:NTP pyrophosphatase (non-canonical NTP hydrolase)